MVSEYGIPDNEDETLEDFMFLDDEWVSEMEVHRVQVNAKGCNLRFKIRGHVLHIIAEPRMIV